MDLEMFVDANMGTLVPIQGTDPLSGPWQHHAFVATPLQQMSHPVLSQATFLAVSNARAAIAALDSTARQLPDPTLLRQLTLRSEAQSTSLLEGTYVPLNEVLVAGDDAPERSDRREVLNYVRMANYAFADIGDGRPFTVAFACALQATLVRGTKDEGPDTGRVRQTQVAVGRRKEAAPGSLPVDAARFIPAPGGDDLEAQVRDLTDWVRTDHSDVLDPIVSAAMAHYQFETLHPFHDGNGRLGRLLIVLQFYMHDVLSEPTLTVSPWFEARRTEYYDRLLEVSTDGNWDDYVAFFARGIRESADLTRRQMMELVSIQERLKETVRDSPLRADTALMLVDFAVANPSFTARMASESLSVSYPRANRLIGQLTELGVVAALSVKVGGSRRFYAPDVIDLLSSVQ